MDILAVDSGMQPHASEPKLTGQAQEEADRSGVEGFSDHVACVLCKLGETAPAAGWPPCHCRSGNGEAKDPGNLLVHLRNVRRRAPAAWPCLPPDPQSGAHLRSNSPAGLRLRPQSTWPGEQRGQGEEGCARCRCSFGQNPVGRRAGPPRSSLPRHPHPPKKIILSPAPPAPTRASCPAAGSGVPPPLCRLASAARPCCLQLPVTNRDSHGGSVPGGEGGAPLTKLAAGVASSGPGRPVDTGDGETPASPSSASAAEPESSASLRWCIKKGGLSVACRGLARPCKRPGAPGFGKGGR